MNQDHHQGLAMINRMLYLLCVACLTVISPIVTASECDRLADMISKDIKKHSAMGDTTAFKWMNLKWLQNQLGTVAPTMNNTGEKEFRWQCTDDIYVVATVSNKQLIAVSGQYSSANGAELFSRSNNVVKEPAASTPVADKEIVERMDSKDLPYTPEDLDAAFNKTKKDVNNWFGTHIESDNQIGMLLDQKIKTYYKKLSTCTPGEYKYAISNTLALLQATNKADIDVIYLASSTIKGMKNNTCDVITVLKSHNNIVKQQVCHYASNLLPNFNDALAESYLKFGESIFKSTNQTMQAIKNDCTVIPTPAEIQKVAALKTFIGKFQSCTPGTYHVPRMGGEEQMVINGYQNGKCKLIGALTFGRVKKTITCAYSQASLDLFSQSSLNSLNKVKTLPNKALYNQHLNAAAKAMQECSEPWVPF